MTQVSDRIQYMLRRTMGLLLGDARGGRSMDVKVGFTPTSAETDRPDFVPLRSVVCLLNLWMGLDSLKRSILPRLTLIHNWTESLEVAEQPASVRRISWSKTIRRWAEGSTGFVERARRRSVDAESTCYLAFVLLEAVTHAEVLGEHFAALRLKMSPAVTDILRSIDATASSISAKVLGCLQEHKDAYRAKEELVRREFAAAVASTEASHEGALSAYGKVVEIEPPRRSATHRMVEGLDLWRRQYLRTAVWLSDNVRFESTGTGDEHHLFELWLFVEMCHVLRRVGRREVVQNNFLRRGRTDPSFTMSDGAYVYFDFCSRHFRDARDIVGTKYSESVSPALKMSRVEWFVRDPLSFEDSVIIDAKYMTWEHSEALKVLGYLLNFGIRRGAMIFRETKDLAAQGGVDCGDGVWRFDCPTERRERLWATAIVPDERERDENDRRLVRLVDEIFRKSYH